MAGPWERYQKKPATSTAARAGGPWERYSSPPQHGDGPGLEIDIVGGTPVPAAEFAREVEQAPATDQPLPSLFRMDSDFRERAGVGIPSMLVAAAKDMFGSRQGAAEYLAGKINEGQGLSALISGGAQAAQDERGNPLLRLADGTSYRLNDPGLDTTDIGNVAGNVAAFWTPAVWASRLGQARRFGLGARAATQAGTAAATDAGLQLGFTGEVDGGRTLAALAGGAGGEVLGTGLGALAQRSGQFRNQFRPLDAGERNALAELAGVSDPTGRVVNNRQLLPELEAGTDPNALLGRELFGFQYTKGQRMTNPIERDAQLVREETLRQAPGSRQVFQDVARHNQQQLGEAVAGIGTRLGGRPGATPAELAQGAATRVQQQADELGGQVEQAYQAASQGARTAVRTDFVATLPQRLRTAVAAFAPDENLHPAAVRTLRQIREGVEQSARGPEGANVSGITLKAIETQRRIINNNVSAAANPADRAATLAIKREFDQWLDEAIDGALASGDPKALDALKDARRLRFEFGRRFEGKEQADQFIAGLLDGSKTPEELINVALGAGQVSKTGGARFIERLRVAVRDDPEAIGSLRAAHFQRLAVGPTGDPLNMGQIVRNIRSTEYSNASVIRALYSPQEWQQVRTLADALEPMIQRGDLARTSGTGERMARMLFEMTGGSRLLRLPIVRSIVSRSGDAVRAQAARTALNEPLRLRARPLPGSQATATGLAVGAE